MLSVLHTTEQGINNSLTRNSLILSTMELKRQGSLGFSLAPSTLVPTHSVQKYPSLLLIPFCVLAMPGFGAMPSPGPEERAAGRLSRPGHQLSLRPGLPIRAAGRQLLQALEQRFVVSKACRSSSPLGSSVPIHHGELSLPRESSSWCCSRAGPGARVFVSQGWEGRRSKRCARSPCLPRGWC